MAGGNFKIRESGVINYFNALQALAVFLIMFVLLSVALSSFLTLMNITNMMKQLAPLLIIAAAMTIVIICGELDISVGSVVALSGICCGLAIIKFGIIAGVITSLAIGFGFGLFNGIITTKGRIPSFITTLGTMMIARSLAYVVSNGQVVTRFPNSYKIVGQGYVLGIPILFIIVIIIYILAYILLKKTKFGQQVYAVGSNRTAAVLCGINADAVKIKALVLSGLMAGLCGVLITSRVMAVQADTGRGMEFEVIAGVIIGGTSLNGGQGNVLQTIIGVLIIGMIRNGLNLSHINIFWNDFVTGSVIIIAVLLDSLRKYIQKRLQERAYLK